MDAWQQSVENRLLSLDSRVENLRDQMGRDFKWTWGGIAVSFVLLSAGLATGFLVLASKIDTAFFAILDKLP